MLAQARTSFLTDAAWKLDPLGHTPYQLRNFVVKNENPTADSQYRQVVRELWTRWQAWRQAKYQYEKQQAEMDALKADVEGLRLLRAVAFLPFWRAKLGALIRLKQIEIEAREQNCIEVSLNAQHVVVRETKVLLDVLKELPAPEEDREKADEEYWAARVNQARMEAGAGLMLPQRNGRR